MSKSPELKQVLFKREYQIQMVEIIGSGWREGLNSKHEGDRKLSHRTQVRGPISTEKAIFNDTGRKISVSMKEINV